MSAQQQRHAIAEEAAPKPEESDGSSAIESGAQTPDVGNVDKIREILFGGQMRDYESRFMRVEERLTKESHDLREDTKRRFEALEQFITNEFTALADRLQAEQKTRDEALQGAWRGIHDTGHTLSAKVAELHDQTERAQSHLRQQILAQSKELTDAMRKNQEEITSMLQREVADLNHGKTDRSSLATLLTEMAMRLNNDLKMPVTN